jgi:putative alpha-1,2-mannosidase
MDKLYNYTPDGYCGDEDNGQTSAWYVFSSLGFYPVTPGSGEYVFGSPLFDRAVLSLQNGKKLTIEAPGNQASNIYVRDIKLNGRRTGKNYINHSDILKGGKLIFTMASEPDMRRGTGEDSFPYSMSTAKE